METGDSVDVVSPETDIIPGVEVAPGEEAIVETTLWYEDATLNIYQRIYLASHAIKKLEKDGKVEIGKSGYGYISHDQTTAAAKRAFRDVGVMVIPSVIKHEKDGNRTELTVQVQFINVDKPDDFFVTEGVGYGVDSSDKGPGKAYSYAMKYIYMKLLMLNSADDIEEGDTRHEPEVSGAQITEAKTTARTAIGEWATAYKSAIENAPSLTVLKELKKEHRKRMNSDDVPEVTRTFLDELHDGKETLLKSQME